MKKHISMRIISLLLTLVLCVGLAAPAGAVSSDEMKVSFEKVDNSSVSAGLTGEKAPETEQEQYSDSDIVRASIILEEKSTIEAGFSTLNIAENAEAMAYRADLQEAQQSMETAISQQALRGEKLDVVWNMTLAANIISANVRFGDIEAIKNVKGVKTVVIETRYEPCVVNKEEANDPNMATASLMIGTPAAYAAGYSGAGSRVAVIDTGVDTDHQSFAPGGLEHALRLNAENEGMTYDEYVAKLDLLDAAEIAEKLDQLNMKGKNFTAEELYVNLKVGFGFNYVDGDLDITHDNDSQGEHGSHVEGIAAANAYIPQGDTYLPALEAVGMQGVAPDAQIITMKVFGKGGGAYDSDYMVAIEDAIVLGADSVNLSLGSAAAGSSRNGTAAYQTILDNLVKSDAVVAMSAGNAGSWVENAAPVGYLYSDGVNMDTAGSPGSFTNSLGVASADNAGSTGHYFTVNGNMVVVTESDYSNEPIASIAGEYEYIFIDGFGTEEDFAAVADVLKGKVAFCSRGSSSFYQKAEAAVNNGAIATVIYNNQAGVINMDLSDYTKTAPCVSITQASGNMVRANSTPVTNEAGDVLYYTGKMVIASGMGSAMGESKYNTISDFSSWGVPGSLELKPEITAPGGSIYSVNGAVAGGQAYELMSGTSMASPQVAGMAALVAQYINENKLSEKTGLTVRALSQSLLMSTAIPMVEEASGAYYPVMRQGAGLANVGKAISAQSYITMADGSNAGAADGKVKVELKDDPERKGVYTINFALHNLNGKVQKYMLNADLFTQNLFENEGNVYMDTWTTGLAATAVWTVNGKVVETNEDLSKFDANDDGRCDGDDVSAILDYVAGKLDKIENADVNGDGEVTSADAYALLNKLNAAAVVLGENETAQISVTLTLTDAQKEALNLNYKNGAYIEGYLFVSGLSTAEGEEGTVHSIPVLGFYGNWSDPSMFDVGTAVTYATGDETRTPYLAAASANATMANALSVIYANDPSSSYVYGGNPLVPDDHYMPERNAFNNQNGDTFGKWSFAAIRNAEASRFQLTKEDGTILEESLPGAVTGAYYYTNGGRWMSYNYTLNTAGVVPSGLQEGERFVASLTLVPEYYVDAEGNVAWDKLGNGVTMSFPGVIDNTAPELLDVSISMTSNTMTITAKDNQYIAAMGLFNAGGTQALAAAGAVQEGDVGQTVESKIDLSGINGKKFLVQVYDYAMNAATYELKMQIGEELPAPDMMAFNTNNSTWIGFGKGDALGTAQSISAAKQNFFAATEVEGMIFASTDEGDLYVLNEEDPSEMTFVRNLGVVATDMAYNATTETLYAVADGDLITIDRLTGAVTTIGTIGVETNTLACDNAGNFYVMSYSTGSLYKFTAETIATPEKIGAATRSNNYVQALEMDPNNGMLYWTRFYFLSFLGIFNIFYSELIEIDPATGTQTAVSADADTYEDELTALVIPLKKTGGGWSSPTDQVDSVVMTPSSANILRGNTLQLSATVLPWTCSDRSVTWASANPEIATVDENGLVTGVAVGTTTVTATSTLDPTKTATCEVIVETVNVTFKGMLQDKDGNPMLFTWDMQNETTWKAGMAIDTNLTSATVDTTNNALYVMDANSNSWSMHKVNMETGKSDATYSNPLELPLWDMYYSTVFSTAEAPRLGAIYYYYYLPAKDPAALTSSAFGFSSYLTQYTGGTMFVATASAGMEKHTDSDGVEHDCEKVFLLDDAGYVWTLWVWPEDDGSYSASILFEESNLVSDLGVKFPLDENGENAYSSMVRGDDGNFYVSAFTGETNEMFRLTYDAANESYKAIRIGDVGDAVWPAALLEAKSNTAPSAQSTKAPMFEISSEPVTDEALAEAAGNASASRMHKTGDNQKANMTAPAMPTVMGSTNAVLTQDDPQSTGETGEKTVTVTVTAKDANGADVAATNGLVSVKYSPADLILTSVNVNAGYKSVNETNGNVKFAYANANEIPAGTAIATLTFQVKSFMTNNVVVTNEQVNNDKPGYTETLTVAEYPFMIVEQPKSAVTDMNGTVNFSIVTNRTEVTYQWQYSNNQGKYWSNSGLPGSNTNKLTVAMMPYRNGQMYRCIATDAEGNVLVSDAVSMTITDKAPKIIKDPQTVYANSGEDAVFTVEAIGEDLTYQWQFSNDGGKSWGNSGAEGANTPSLTIRMAKYRNGQMYRCVVSNVYGRFASAAATLSLPVE